MLNAIKSGFREAACPATLVVMADLSDDLRIVPRMYELIEQGYDVVCGSRYMKGGKQIGGPVFKGLLSRLAGLTLHWFAGLPTRDVTNSFKMYRTAFLRGLQFESTGGFEIGMEAVVKAHVSGGRIEGEISAARAEAPGPPTIRTTAASRSTRPARGGAGESSCLYAGRILKRGKPADLRGSRAGPPQ